MQPFHWAILGPGKIARKFAEDLVTIPDAKLVSVASRSLDRARAFANDFGAEYAAGSYATAFDGPRVDAVYVATPHTSHAELTLLCLKKGIPVLCEKPLGLNLAEVERMVATAREENVYLMEALWSRFLPSFLEVKKIIAAGTLGKLESLRADFGFKANPDPTSRLWDPALGGGALLDIGIYPVWLAHFLLGPPKEINATARLTDRGVDAEVEVTMRHAGGQLSHSHATLLGTTRCDGLILGERADVHLHPRFHETAGFSLLTGKDAPPQPRYFQFACNGYKFEAQAVMDDVRSGRKESPLWSLADSLALHRTLTEVRKIIGVSYPGEPAPAS